MLPGVSDGDDDEFEMGVEDVAVDGADVMDNNVGIQQDVLTPAEANRKFFLKKLFIFRLGLISIFFVLIPRQSTDRL